jgi:hypothetical protein
MDDRKKGAKEQMKTMKMRMMMMLRRRMRRTETRIKK